MRAEFITSGQGRSETVRVQILDRSPGDGREALIVCAENPFTRVVFEVTPEIGKFLAGVRLAELEEKAFTPKTEP